MKSQDHHRFVLISPFALIALNIVTCLAFGSLIGKWAFVPVILIEWGFFSILIWAFSEAESRRRWLSRASGGTGWKLLALVTGLIPFPIMLLNYRLLGSFEIFLPWLVLAIVNPWLEEFYWRGLLMDRLVARSKWLALVFSSVLFAANHAVFGINSELMRGPELVVSTLIMGFVWGAVYLRTRSLRWTIAAHFMVDLFSLSAPAFLDLIRNGR